MLGCELRTFDNRTLVEGNRAPPPKRPSALRTSFHYAIWPGISSINVPFFLKDKENTPRKLEVKEGLQAFMGISLGRLLP